MGKLTAKIAIAVLLLFGVLASAVGAALAGLWFCFDDALASLFNYPPLGEVPFAAAWAFFTLVMLLTGKPRYTSNGKGN